MGYQKNTSNGLNLKKSLGLSIFLHGALFALLVFGLHGDTEKPAGSGESEIISVSLVSPSFVRRGQGEVVDIYPTPASSEQGFDKANSLPWSTGPSLPVRTPLQRGGGSSGTRPSISEQKLAATGVGEGGEGGASTILQQIRNKIERQKYYPLLAKRSRMEGSPLIEFKIKSDGSLEYVTLKQSSGSKLLDEAAATTVRQAAPYPFYPDPIALNIHYELNR